ncbi:hypothetical protein GCM10017714_05980 [Curtobacterium pusillum]|uniref:Multisubunit Na+/H+ antiporter MnhC subunit n=1 Tax=Curtobacterium pusillum TaxID=69373 RepID=A0AAW3T7J4_9MICO|nr:hypothetical protein [Curtobacterium pusillum]MBA8990578.1 multisubunit Na+/H+ antiporter MnhC subunit [Curtobacterium pusillum]NUU12534.1 hypothetical protein [Curtobacterium pusillum]GLK29861.1 hypothetical protein GCM10017610_01460 [Curtobacterium pusillum]
MAETQNTRDTWRSIVGYPYRWQGVGLAVLGLFWLGLVVTGDRQLWRLIVGVAWLALGVTLLVVSLSDHRHGRGRYAGRSTGGQGPQGAPDAGDR